MLKWFAVILGFQLAGEVVARLFAWPVPGPVIGMVLLFLGLYIRGRTPEGLDQVAGTILSHLMLFLVPASVGIITHVALLEREWLPIGAAVLLSTLLAFAVTGISMSLLFKAFGKKNAPDQGEAAHD